MVPSRVRVIRPPTTRQLVTAANVAVVACCCVFVWLQLQPHLLLSPSTPSGGDMGAHVWGPAYLRDHLLPQGRLTGWTNDWYDGFPALTFYFPLPSLMIALLSFVLPYGVAFKLVTVLGLVSLPACAAAFGMLTGMRRPYAACLAVATVPFLFDRAYTIYGGNVASTLAGEFSFSISLSFALLFLGVLAKSLDTGRYRGWAALLFGCTVLCHILPAMFAVVAAVLITLTRPRVRSLLTTAISGATGAAIAGFWLIPFALRLPYTNDMGWEKIDHYLLPLIGGHATSTELNAIGQANLDPELLRWLFLAALAGAVVSVALRRRIGTVLTGTAIMAALAFRFMPGPTAGDPFAHGKLWNARMLPFWYLSLYLLAACLVAEIALGIIALYRLVDRAASPAGVTEAKDRAHQARLLAHLCAALCLPVGDAARAAASALDARVDDLRERGAASRAVPQVLVPAVAAFVVLGLVAAPFGHSWFRFLNDKVSATYLDDWARWNYVGYDGDGDGPQRLGEKSRRDEYFEVVRLMESIGKDKDRGCGRAFWEYEPELDAMGTPMALMLLPYWTNGCIGSSEGLYFESSPTTPAHFMTAGSVSKSPSNPQRSLPYTALDLANVGIPRMQLLGDRYYMAISPDAQAQADADPRLTLIAQSGSHPVNYPSGQIDRFWKVYEVAGSQLVQPLANVPVVVQGVPNTEPAWKALAARGWFAEPSRTEVFLAASGPKAWPRVAAPAAEQSSRSLRVEVGDWIRKHVLRQDVLTPPTPDDNEPYRKLGAETELPTRAIPAADQPTISNVKQGDSSLSFTVDKVGAPVLVKVSYFPNWTVKGADGPYRVSPNLMVVIPRSTNVSLHYGTTPVDALGIIASLLGLALVVVLNRRLAPDGPVTIPWLRRRTRGEHEKEPASHEPADAPASVYDRGLDPDTAPQKVLVSAGSAPVGPEDDAQVHEPGDGAGDPPGDRGP
jgi:hypothetical protein